MGASLLFARMRILLLEEDQETAEALVKGLAQEGHDVSAARDVAAASQWIATTSFDAAVLDVMVPGGSGYDVLALLRGREPRVPALMLTARGAVEDRVAGLDQGADDYLVKPFSFAELAGRSDRRTGWHAVSRPRHQGDRSRTDPHPRHLPQER